MDRFERRGMPCPKAPPGTNDLGSTRGEAESELNRLGFSSKLIADWGFFTELRELGRVTADAGLEANDEGIAVESSRDIGDERL